VITAANPVIIRINRLKEIINIATKIKTTSLTVYLKPDIAEESLLAKNIKQELTYTTLHTVTAAMEIWYDPDPQFVHVLDCSYSRPIISATQARPQVAAASNKDFYSAFSSLHCN
jgi:hypothetical protein